MKYIKCEQGQPEWYQARCGKITASTFADAISVLSRASGAKVKGDPTEASDRCACEVAIERVSEMPWGEPIKPWVLQRGHDLEPLARSAYERYTGTVVEEAGVCLTDDAIFGYSTDGLVNPRGPVTGGVLIGCDGLLEIKCPVDAKKVMTIWTTGDISEYFEQTQGGMWITGAQWCDLVMFVPELAGVGRALYIQRIQRDELFIRDMVEKLQAFRWRVDALEATLRKPRMDAANDPTQLAA